MHSSVLDEVAERVCSVGWGDKEEQAKVGRDELVTKEAEGMPANKTPISEKAPQLQIVKVGTPHRPVRHFPIGLSGGWRPSKHPTHETEVVPPFSRQHNKQGDEASQHDTHLSLRVGCRRNRSPRKQSLPLVRRQRGTV